MQNEQLILNRLMEIQEDIGGMKSAQDNCEDQMEELKASIETVKKNCETAVTIEVTKKQIIVFGGTVVTAIAGLLGYGATQ